MMKKLLLNRTTIFILFALAAVALMGSALVKPAGTDLHNTAKTLAEESSAALNCQPEKVAIAQPGAILRANVIK